MLKIKIYQIENKISKQIIYENLKSNLYSDEVGFGFELIDDNEHNFIVQFVERVINKIEVESVDGNISEIESVSYVRIKFGVRFDTKNALYIINPPRSMKYLFEMIRLLFGSTSKLKPLELDLKQVLKEFDVKFEVLIKSMSLSNIQCDPNTVAKTTVASTKDLHDFYLKEYSKTSAIIDAVNLLLNGVSIELSRTGRFRMPEAYIQRFLLMLDGSI
ncbi:hypothetical protein [Aeromonas veronii]|uniref:hypothetical protein n=1 Tax=Aeromonas veronii TaxID=654 RepID=UPI0002805731|nr:hypothetical protein [Aeromonas veronii]EKB12185.1 hypothetical protein HMPREF1167_02223 [Aeromonas veronii AER39]